ncbi:MAG: S-methyl-5-thioribose-1-phosphate isomerase [archaeon]|nr:MAG: S-methyl-5-thioribose-1-phosphate isomerase [archaeon]
MKVKTDKGTKEYRTVWFDRESNAVRMINQPLLPHRFEIIDLKNYRETASAISNMVVRGAGAIGATGAYGLAQGCLAFRGNLKDFWKHVEKVYQTLKNTRPTAVDLVNGMDFVIREVKKGNSLEECQELAIKTSQKFADEDAEHCKMIGEHGEKLIKNGFRVLTHCNAGWLAFVDWGSATAPMYRAKRKDKEIFVFVDETRPRLQGARLTAWELSQEGIKHAIIADNAAGYYMKRGEVDMVIVGSDRTVAETGDVANKIGTYEKAVLAKENNIPFYVAIPMSTLDWNLGSGEEIPIEERDGEEVLFAWGSDGKGERVKVRVANASSLARNPAFDVTPAKYITGIITPRGIFKPEELVKLKD